MHAGPSCPLFSRVSLALALVLIAAAAEAGLPPEFTLRRPSEAAFYADYDDNGVPNRVWQLGATTDVALLADADGDTLADAILYRSGAWYVDLRNDHVIDRTALMGSGSDIPVVGDFLGDGRAGFALGRPGRRPGGGRLERRRQGGPRCIP